MAQYAVSEYAISVLHLRFKWKYNFFNVTKKKKGYTYLAGLETFAVKVSYATFGIVQSTKNTNGE